MQFQNLTTLRNNALKYNLVEGQLFTKGQNFGLNQVESNLMGECNTIVNAYTLYRHLQQYCTHLSICR